MNIVIGAGLTGCSLAQDDRIDKVVGPYWHTAMSQHSHGASIDLGIHVINTMTDKLKALNIDFKERIRYAVISMDINGNNHFVDYPYQSNEFAQDNGIDSLFNHDSKTYAEYLINRFGEHDYFTFHYPYNSKFWGQHYFSVGKNWCKTPAFPVGAGINSTFYYPKQGGIGVIREKLLEKVKHKYIEDTVEFIDIKEKKVYLGNGGSLEYDTIYNTAPLPELRMAMPPEVRNLIQSLKHTSIYVDTEESGTVLYDWKYSPSPKNHWFRCSSVAHDKTMQYESLAPTVDKGYIQRDFIKYAYWVPEDDYEEKMGKINKYFNSVGIHNRGRQGRATNMWMHSCLEETL